MMIVKLTEYHATRPAKSATRWIQIPNPQSPTPSTRSGFYFRMITDGCGGVEGAAGCSTRILPVRI